MVDNIDPVAGLSLILRVGEKSTSSLESNLEGLASVLEADLSTYKSEDPEDPGGVCGEAAGQVHHLHDPHWVVEHQKLQLWWGMC